MSDRVLCVDGGGSSTQVCICDSKDFESQSCCIDVGPVSLKSSSTAEVEESFKNIANLFVANDDLASSTQYAVFALSGLDRESDIEHIVDICKHVQLVDQTSSIIEGPYGHIVKSTYGFPILLCSDALLPLFAEGYNAGVSIISGTGSVALSIKGNGTYKRIGGRGYRVSDSGSGYWVGAYLVRNALRAAEAIKAGHMRIHGSLSNIRISNDLMWSDQQNSELVCSLIGACIALGYTPEGFDENNDLDWINDDAYKVCEWAANHDDPKNYAALAKSALEHESILNLSLPEKTAEQLSELALIALGNTDDIVVASGGIFRNSSVKSHFAELIHTHTPAAEIVTSNTNLLIGAFNIATSVFGKSAPSDLSIEHFKRAISEQDNTAYELVKNRDIYILQSKALKQFPWLYSGTTLRLGGVSIGYTASLNFCLNEYDFPKNVEENYLRLCSALDTTPDKLASVHQVHGSKVVTVDAERVSSHTANASDLARGMWLDDADALITDLEGITLCIYTADCVPISIVDPIHRAIGIAHAGWRGTLKKIAAQTIAAMSSTYGTRATDAIVQIGPSICKDCYEVDDVVANEARMIFSADTLADICTPKERGEEKRKYQFDLWKANAEILSAAGVLPENIHYPEICTCCNSEYMFSHRASNGKRGTMMTFLGIK